MKRINFKNKYSWWVIVVCAVVSTVAIFAAGWTIINPDDTTISGYPEFEADTHTANTDAGTCTCGFTSTTIFTGQRQTPIEYNTEKPIFGEDVQDNWFIVEDGHLHQISGRNVGLTHAGEYTIDIIDSSNGQMICDNHTFIIHPVVFNSANNFNNDPVFAGNILTVTYTWIRSDNEQITKSYTQSDIAKDFAVAGTTTNTSDVAVNNVSKTVSSDIFYSAFSGGMDDGMNYSDSQNMFTNNYYINVCTSTYTVLPTCYTTVNNGIPTYYSTLNHALDQTKNTTADTKLVAMQGYTVAIDSKTNCTFSANPNDAANSNVKYRAHTITGEKTVGSKVTLRIPNGIGASDNISMKVGATTWTYSQVDENKNEGLALIMNETSSPAIHSNAYYTSEWCANTVQVQGTATNPTVINNNGTIIIDAVVTGGAGGAPYNSIVFGYYSKMTLNQYAKIKNTGKINCYGFIDEETPTDYDPDLVISDAEGINNVQLDMQSGTLNTIFTILEHRGGDVFMGMVNPTEHDLNSAINIKVGSPPSTDYVYAPNMTTFAFHRFYIQSVSVNMMVSHSANINGEVTMFANGGPNQAMLSFMGKSYVNGTETQAPIFELGDSAYATFKYTHCQENPNTEDQEAVNRKMNIDTYGDVTLNPLVLRLTIEETRTLASVLTAYAKINLDLNTGSCPLPFSHYFDISFNDNGTKETFVDLTQQPIKILPGGSVTVGSNTTVEASQIVVYKDNDLLNGRYYDGQTRDIYPTLPSGAEEGHIAQGLAYPEMDGGSLTIYGSLSVDDFGGNVKAASTEAILSITNNATGKNYAAAVSQELMTNYKTQINVRVVYLTAAYSLPIDYKKSCYSTEAISTIDAQAKVATSDKWATDKTLYASTYTGVERDDTFVWYNNNAAVTLYANGGAFISHAGSATTANVLVPVNAESGLDVSQITLIPQREGYVFGEWYLDPEFTKPLSEHAETITYDTELYARWKQVATVEFNSSMAGATQISSQPVTLTYEGTPETLDAFSEKPSIYGYKFIGWYLSAADDSEKVTENTNIRDNMIGNTLTVYAKWEEATTYTVEHISGKEGITFVNGKTILSEDDPYSSMPKISAADNAYDKSYYLIGWSLENDGTIDENIFFTQAPADGETLKLYAVWGTKIEIRFNINNSKLSIDDPSPIYLKPSETYNVWNFSVTDKLHSGDETPTNEKYWNEGFAVSGSGIMHDYIITATADENNVLIVQPVWENKVNIKVSHTTDRTTDNAVTAKFSISFSRTNNNDNPDEYYRATNIQSIDVYIHPEHYFKFYSITSHGDNMSLNTEYNTKAGNCVGTTEFIIHSNTQTCLIEGTLITLADGTQKKVEDLTKDDLVLVFNHETGKFETGYIATLDHLDMEKQWTNVINLEFSNGELLRIHNVHGLFDVTLNEYVFITEENMTDYVGHEFYSTYYNGTEFVSEIITLTDAYVTEEFTKVYCPLTAVHMNHFAGGILAFTPTPYNITTGHTNIFVYGDDLKYDEESMQADIEKYGLFTYEDLADYLTEEQFNALPFKYFKVSIGKGLMTWEEMLYCIEYVMGG